MGLKLLLGYLILINLFLNPLCSYSEAVYRWTDEKGTVHFTDDPSKIPEKFSEQAEKPGKPEGKSDRVKDYLHDLDRKIEVKRRMEKRISELEEELRVSEERLMRIEEYEKEDFQYYLPYIDRRTGKLVPIASPYYEEKRGLERRIESINAELRTLKEEISNLMRSL